MKTFIIMIALILLIIMMVYAKQGNSMSFDFPNFPINTEKLHLERDAFVVSKGLELTMNRADRVINGSIGRASYSDPVQLWDPKNHSRLADFTTHFTFSIKEIENLNASADGMAFFLAPFDSVMSDGAGGWRLGLGWVSPYNSSFVAVEFDTFQNYHDVDNSSHVGIDINSLVSNVSRQWTDGSMKDGRVANSWVRYNSTSHNLTVYLTYDQDPVLSEKYCFIWYQLDLRVYLPETIRVGFTASTGRYVETHTVHSWSFDSSLELIANETIGLDPPSPTPQGFNGNGSSNKKNNNSNRVLAIGLGMGFSLAIVCAIGIFFFFRLRRRGNTDVTDEEDEYNPSIDGEFERGAGPKRFTYNELRLATRDFSEDGKLGEGGFGGVYKGLLSGSAGEVAVKRISKASSQGQKEYVSEVKIISLLRHRNLVQLIGWCHKQSEFLLVYEYLSNGSLDTHLFGGKVTMALPWNIRHKIGLGLASALLYLHEEWEQCVVHRDIKSSNVMLDANFNAKLGDFGLARLVDHEYSLHTVAFAGTMGYIAPECMESGKSSKESDVYSFGVVALEICCGRRSVVPNAAEPNKVKLVNWVWELYGKGQLFEAVDRRLNEEFEAKEVECLMIVGLWCCHPDPNFRPTMKQIMNVLNFEAPLPNNLPRELPRPTYSVTPLNISLDSYTSSSVYTGSSYPSSNSTTESSSKPLLNFAQS